MQHVEARNLHLETLEPSLTPCPGVKAELDPGRPPDLPRSLQRLTGAVTQKLETTGVGGNQLSEPFVSERVQMSWRAGAAWPAPSQVRKCS